MKSTRRDWEVRIYVGVCLLATAVWVKVVFYAAQTFGGM